MLGDFSGGPVFGNLPAKAGDMNSTSGWGTKIPHAAGQLLSLGSGAPVPPEKPLPAHHNTG